MADTRQQKNVGVNASRFNRTRSLIAPGLSGMPKTYTPIPGTVQTDYVGPVRELLGLVNTGLKSYTENKTQQEIDAYLKASAEGTKLPQFTMRESFEFAYGQEAYKVANTFVPEQLDSSDPEAESKWIDANSAGMPDYFKHQLKMRVMPAMAAWNQQKTKNAQRQALQEGAGNLTQILSDSPYEMNGVAELNYHHFKAYSSQAEAMGLSKDQAIQNTIVPAMQAAVAKGDVNTVKQLTTMLAREGRDFMAGNTLEKARDKWATKKTESLARDIRQDNIAPEKAIGEIKVLLDEKRVTSKQYDAMQADIQGACHDKLLVNNIKAAAAGVPLESIGAELNKAFESNIISDKHYVSLIQHAASQYRSKTKLEEQKANVRLKQQQQEGLVSSDMNAFMDNLIEDRIVSQTGTMLQPTKAAIQFGEANIIPGDVGLLMNNNLEMGGERGVRAMMEYALIRQANPQLSDRLFNEFSDTAKLRALFVWRQMKLNMPALAKSPEKNDATVATWVQTFAQQALSIKPADYGSQEEIFGELYDGEDRTAGAVELIKENLPSSMGSYDDITITPERTREFNKLYAKIYRLERAIRQDDNIEAAKEAAIKYTTAIYFHSHPPMVWGQRVFWQENGQGLPYWRDMGFDIIGAILPYSNSYFHDKVDFDKIITEHHPVYIRDLPMPDGSVGGFVFQNNFINKPLQIDGKVIKVNPYRHQMSDSTKIDIEKIDQWEKNAIENKQNKRPRKIIDTMGGMAMPIMLN